jgi:parvulin-like peptidyl-prolyl isomerase
MKFTGAILGGVLALCGTLNLRAETANGIRAVVHDSVITYQDVDILNAQTANELRRQYAGQPEQLARKAAEVQTNNVEQLLAKQLILKEFKTAGYTLPDSVIDDVVRERIRARYGDRVTATKSLDAQGITFEKFREQVKEEFIVRAMRDKNVSQEIIISPYKVEKYYLEHRDEYKLEDQVKLRMIVINKADDVDARKLAGEIMTRLKEGTPFAEMATVYSQGSQRKDGGDWGWVERSVLRKELADAAFSLKPGERSPIIELGDACYLMLVEDTRPTHYKALGEVREQIEQNLMVEEKKRLEQQWIERLKKKTFVRHF